MTITGVLKNEAAETVYADAEEIRRMIAESDAEGGELTCEEVSRHLDTAIDAVRN